MGLAAMFLIALTMVQRAYGMQTYRSAGLAEESWIGFPVSVGWVSAALVPGAAFRFRGLLEERSLKKMFKDRRKKPLIQARRQPGLGPSRVDRAPASVESGKRTVAHRRMRGWSWQALLF